MKIPKERRITTGYFQQTELIEEAEECIFKVKNKLDK